jgi:signal transduction histidine kinase
VALRNDLLRTLLTDEAPDRPLRIYADGRESYFTKETLEVLLPAADSPGSNGQAISAGRVVVLRNITSFKELDLAKTNFIATISHELKTPIASLKMSLRLLENEKLGTLNAEQRQLLAQIGDDAGRLLNITGELLDLSQAETGNIQLNLQFVSPRDVVDLAVQAIRLQAEQKGVGLDVEVSETPPVQADLEKTAWVLVNFLSNAVRYSPENGRVSVKVIQKSDKVVFSVQDQGPGIAAQYQPRIFDKFFQVPGDIRGRSGTGLGLAIAKDFVTAQGGRIGVESESGHGSVFFFELNAA